MSFPLILAGVGAAISIYGQIKGAEADAEAARREAASRELEAQEILKRTKINQEIVQEEGDILMGAQQNFFASSGVQMVGSPLLLLERTAHGIAREKHNMQMESEFRANQLRAGAALSRELADQRQSAGYLQAAGTALTSIYGISSAAPKKTPKVTDTTLGGSSSSRSFPSEKI